MDGSQVFFVVLIVVVVGLVFCFFNSEPPAENFGDVLGALGEHKRNLAFCIEECDKYYPDFPLSCQRQCEDFVTSEKGAPDVFIPPERTSVDHLRMWCQLEMGAKDPCSLESCMLTHSEKSKGWNW